MPAQSAPATAVTTPPASDAARARYSVRQQEADTVNGAVRQDMRRPRAARPSVAARRLFSITITLPDHHVHHGRAPFAKGADSRQKGRIQPPLQPPAKQRAVPQGSIWQASQASHANPARNAKNHARQYMRRQRVLVMRSESRRLFKMPEDATRNAPAPLHSAAHTLAKMRHYGEEARRERRRHRQKGNIHAFIARRSVHAAMRVRRQRRQIHLRRSAPYALYKSIEATQQRTGRCMRGSPSGE